MSPATCKDATWEVRAHSTDESFCRYDWSLRAALSVSLNTPDGLRVTRSSNAMSRCGSPRPVMSCCSCCFSLLPVPAAYRTTGHYYNTGWARLSLKAR